MKIKFLSLITIYLFLFSSCNEKKVFELPLTEKYGYNHFNPTFGKMFYYSQNENNIIGIPKSWENIQFGEIETNPYQSVYEDYILGKISNDRYENIQKSWNWEPDTLTLSKKPLKISIAFAFVWDSIGNINMIVDANQNQDFSDDTIFTPCKISELDNDTLVLKNSINVSYESYANQTIHSLTAPLLIVTLSDNDPWFSFPQYLTTSIKNQRIDISSGFSSLIYDKPEIALINDSLNFEAKINDENLFTKNEFIDINDELFKVIGINTLNNSLTLEKVELPKNELQSTAIGFKAFPFEGKDIITESLIKSDDLKGKYVFIDFWATWCGPCIAEFRTLKMLYDKTDREKFEIIGIVGESSLNDVKKIIKRDSVTWPQLLSSDSNQIVERYGIDGYPTSFLINPNGVIIAKNIRIGLEQKVLKLINE